jgi:hypothetical protein
MRTHPRYLLALALLVGGGVLLTQIALPAQGGSTVQRGAAVAPVPLNMKGLNPALVREGSYIVNAQGGCNDCHTYPSYAPGGNPFIGEPEVVNTACYQAGGALFGPFRSRNLTPDENGLPAGRELWEFKQLMQHGTDFRGDATPILQVMPWPVYGKMVDRDLEAVYEYLKAIPSIQPRPAACNQPAPPA